MHAETAKRAYHRRGYTCLARRADSDETIEGNTYSISDVDHVVTSDGGVFAKRSEDWRYARVDDPAVLREIAEKIAADMEISRARDAVAAERGGADELLVQAIRWHLDFTGGVIKEPVRKRGVRFYQVGRNVSHDFFIGTKNGKRYVRAFGEVGWNRALDIPRYEDCVDEVQDWADCYLGHY